MRQQRSSAGAPLSRPTAAVRLFLLILSSRPAHVHTFAQTAAQQQPANCGSGSTQCVADGGWYCPSSSYCDLTRPCLNMGGFSGNACPLFNLPASCTGTHDECSADGGFYCISSTYCSLTRTCPSDTGFQSRACPLFNLPASCTSGHARCAHDGGTPHTVAAPRRAVTGDSSRSAVCVK